MFRGTEAREGACLDGRALSPTVPLQENLSPLDQPAIEPRCMLIGVIQRLT